MAFYQRGCTRLSARAYLCWVNVLCMFLFGGVGGEFTSAFDSVCVAFFVLKVLRGGPADFSAVELRRHYAVIPIHHSDATTQVMHQS